MRVWNALHDAAVRKPNITWMFETPLTDFIFNDEGEVIGVDSVESAIRDARQNARHNGVENARFVAADAGEFMRRLAADGERADVVLMDPPRAGSSEEFLAAAVTLAPRRIVYISCNPTTQVRDLAFLRQRGYAVRTVQPVDMFPHTDHIETIALVERVEGFFERSDR